MKKFTYLVKTQKTLLAAGLCVIFLGSCNKSMTRSDVQDQVESAQEATRDAQEETQAAVEAREQYTENDMRAQIEALEDRSKDIDDRIADLKRSAERTDNKKASKNIDRAIKDLEDEKDDLNDKIADINDMDPEDWSDSYSEIDDAIGRIEGEIDKISQSLSDNE